MNKSDLDKLNKAAQDLFGQLDNLDNSKGTSSFIDELEQLNNWRKNILEFAYNLAVALGRFQSEDTTVKIRDRIRPLIDSINEFTSIPTKESDKKIIIRHRGLSPSAKSGESEFFLNNDYVISVGDCVIDNQQLDYLVKFGIMDAKELGKKLKKTFQFFHHAKIYVLEISYNDWELKDKENVHDALVSWGRYLVGSKKGNGVILDETRQPNPSLTILAGLNKLNIEKFQEMTDKVHRLTLQEKSREKFKEANSIYDAIFLIDDLKSKFTQSPIEINNNKYIKMWRQCFDKNGKFNRTRFNQHRSMLLNWENAFYIFWVDLKSVAIDDDRNTILNCIVRFIADSGSIDEYVDYLLRDFYYYPLYLQFSDRDSLFVSNLLLFKNYVNITYDFGRTPGEVLFSKDPLNEELLKRLHTKITNEWSDKFLQKIITIKKNLKTALMTSEKKENIMPINFLINIMREVFIFLTLVWDKEFKRHVSETVKEYANPKSDLYHSSNSQELILPLLQFFQIIILCLVKLGDERDSDLLYTIKSRKSDYLSIKRLLPKDTALQKQLVNKIMSVVDDGVLSVQKIPATQSTKK